MEFHTNAEVENVDFVGHTVTTKDGKKWTYNKAIFATGGVPKRLPMPGFKELGNVFVLRDIFDAEKILAASGEGKKVIIVGSSFIGLELANCLAGKKCDVTVIGQESAPLERVLGEKVGKIVQNILENKSGIKFKLNVGVEDAKPSAGDSTKVGSVALKGGESVEADFVVLGVGVAPATEYLKNSGIKLEEDGSVSVDNHWRIEGVEDAYAVGDIATYPYPYSSENQKVRIGKPAFLPPLTQLLTYLTIHLSQSIGTWPKTPAAQQRSTSPPAASPPLSSRSSGPPSVSNFGTVDTAARLWSRMMM